MPLFPSNNRVLRKIRRKLFNTRFFTISVLFHVVLLLALGGTVIMQQSHEQADFTGGDGDSKFVASDSTAPPPPMEDVYIAAPGPGFTWVRGAWVWHGRWVWERGHWVHPPRHGAVWIAPHYEYHQGRHVFIGGRWN